VCYCFSVCMRNRRKVENRVCDGAFGEVSVASFLVREPLFSVLWFLLDELMDGRG